LLTLPVKPGTSKTFPILFSPETAKLLSRLFFKSGALKIPELILDNPESLKRLDSLKISGLMLDNPESLRRLGSLKIGLKRSGLKKSEVEGEEGKEGNIVFVISIKLLIKKI